MLEDVAAYFTVQVEAGRLRGNPAFLARYFCGILFAYVVARKLWNDDAPDTTTLDALVDHFLNGVSA